MANAITTLITLWRGSLVGYDKHGNKYYQDKKQSRLNGRVRRWVIYKGEAHADKVPPLYHAWLHHTIDTFPATAADELVDYGLPHIPNLSGRASAYTPKGAINKDKVALNKTYQAWIPE